MDLCFIDLVSNNICLSITDSLLLNKGLKYFSFDDKGIELLNEFIAENGFIYFGYDIQKLFALVIDKFNVYFDFEYFDILRLYRAYYGIKEEPSIEDLSYDYEIELNKSHPSLSMFSFLLEDSGLSSLDFINGDYSDCKLNARKSGTYQFLLNQESAYKDKAISSLLEKGIKGVFVFDFECSNSDMGIGKICELGAIYLDNKLENPKEIEILINPESPFKLGSDISLFYSQSQYTSSPNLKNSISKFISYFEDDSILKIGYAAKNDISFLVTDLNRYGLKFKQFVCFDVQPLADEELDSSRDISLGEANMKIVGDLGNNREHRSVDDAKLTLRLFKYFLSNQELTGFLASNKNCFKSSYNLLELKNNKLVKVAYW